MTWLLDTLVWTGALIALVLVLRRPVARHFGARSAYALWLLPLLRLLMPPLVLPAPAPAPLAKDPGTLELAAALAAAERPSAPIESAITSQPDWWLAIEIGLVSIWLVGAAIYIVFRLAAYRRLRAELLVDARVVGHAGPVRLVETPATRSPLAFGVFDKVVALPVGFMALSDRTARDLALAHELAHHRARDLAANFAALPLFALHWFNPLSWLGWRAMRRDQEAACDARVVAGCDRFEKARYAALIAWTAAVPAPRIALAAPMACPVLGDKSIIQRLRNLTMEELSVRRRRSGGAIIALAALALPLTASITYAHGGDQPVAPQPPTPPEAPAAPGAPLAPSARPAPPPPLVEADPSGDGHRVMMIRTKDRNHAEVDRKIVVRSADGKDLHPESPEFEMRMKELEKHLADLDKHIEHSGHLDEKRIKVIELRAREAADGAARTHGKLAHDMARVEFACDDEGKATETKTEDGRRIVRICRKTVMANAVNSLRSARAAIAGNNQIDADTRRKVLEELDREIVRIESKPNG